MLGGAENEQLAGALLCCLGGTRGTLRRQDGVRNSCSAVGIGGDGVRPARGRREAWMRPRSARCAARADCAGRSLRSLIVPEQVRETRLVPGDVLPPGVEIILVPVGDHNPGEAGGSGVCMESGCG